MPTMQVGGVPPPLSTRTIVGTFKVGTRKVGWSTANQFGTVRAINVYVAGGVGSAQAFGTPTILKGAVSRSVTGVPSAQAFGAITIKAVRVVAVSGRGSAQAFGIVSVSTTGKVSPAGVPSAQ